MNGLRVLTSRVALVLLVVFLNGPARAIPAILDFTSIGYQNSLSSADRTQGWIFTALDDIEVTHLGLWDQAGDGLVTSHRVGIWDGSGILLGDNTVLAGTASQIYGGASGGGSFRYEPVAPIQLDAGATYTIGALFNNDDPFEYYAVAVLASTSIEYLEERYGEAEVGFGFPDQTYQRWGLYGPNFLYREIPEPATLGLFGIGLAGLGIVSRRRKAA